MNRAKIEALYGFPVEFVEARDIKIGDELLGCGSRDDFSDWVHYTKEWPEGIPDRFVVTSDATTHGAFNVEHYRKGHLISRYIDERYTMTMVIKGRSGLEGFGEYGL